MSIFKISTEQAGADLDSRAADLQLADEAVHKADAELQAADLANDATLVVRREAHLTKVKLERARAARALKAAEERFDLAQGDALSEVVSKSKRQRDKALKSRREAAKLIDSAYATLANAVVMMQEADDTLHHCSVKSKGVISLNAIAGYNFGGDRVRQLLAYAEAKANIPGADQSRRVAYGGLEKIPSTVGFIKKDNTTILSDLDTSSDLQEAS